MNAKTAKRLRKAARLAATPDTTYEQRTVKQRFWERPRADGQKSLEQCHIVQPIALKRGSPRQVYGMLKRLERNVGLDNVYRGLLEEHLGGVIK